MHNHIKSLLEMSWQTLFSECLLPFSPPGAPSAAGHLGTAGVWREAGEHGYPRPRGRVQHHTLRVPLPRGVQDAKAAYSPTAWVAGWDDVVWSTWCCCCRGFRWLFGRFVCFGLEEAAMIDIVLRPIQKWFDLSTYLQTCLCKCSAHPTRQSFHYLVNSMCCFVSEGLIMRINSVRHVLKLLDIRIGSMETRESCRYFHCNCAALFCLTV